MECRQRALAALGREAECADPNARAEWLQLSQSWLALAAIADDQDSGEHWVNAGFQIDAVLRSAARGPWPKD
jgi:hypothetical protein